MTADLTLHEVADLATYEQQVERGLSTFLDVGRALLAIRDQRLYRATHDTFDVYVENRWPSLGRSHAYRLLDAARVADAMSPIGDTPTNEAQARELAPLLDQPERLRETWQQVNEQTGGKPTAAAIRAVVKPAVVTTTVTETVEVDTETGEVLTLEEWAETPTERAVVTARPSFDALVTAAGGPDPDAALRARCSRDVSSLTDLSLIDPTAAARIATERGYSDAWRVAFRQHALWVEKFEAALRPGLRMVQQ